MKIFLLTTKNTKFTPFFLPIPENRIIFRERKNSYRPCPIKSFGSHFVIENARRNDLEFAYKLLVEDLAVSHVSKSRKAEKETFERLLLGFII